MHSEQITTHGQRGWRDHSYEVVVALEASNLVCMKAKLAVNAAGARVVWLQDSRLNYVEQHAERMGLDSDKLESLRVSASKASPMGDTLDLCARYADSKTLEEMV